MREMRRGTFRRLLTISLGFLLLSLVLCCWGIDFYYRSWLSILGNYYVDTIHQSSAVTTENTHISPTRYSGKTKMQNDEDVLPPWILEYIYLHNISVHEIIKAKSTISTEGGKIETMQKFLVYQCKNYCGGIGDRMRGMIRVFYLAILTQRIFLIDYDNEGFSLADVFEENLIHWNWRPYKGLEFKNVKTVNAIDHALDENYLKTGDEDVIVVRTNLWNPHKLWASDMIQTHLARFNYSENPFPTQIYKWAFDSLFQKSLAITRQIETYKKQMFNNKHGEGHHSYISLHLRIGDNATTWNDPPRHSLADADSVLECGHKIQMMMRENRPSDTVHLFFASDSNYAKERIQIKDNTVKSLDVPLYHVDRTKHSSRESTTKGNLAAWSEFLLISESECIVASRSGYSEIAALITGNNCSVHFFDCSDESIQRKDLTKLIEVNELG